MLLNTAVARQMVNCWEQADARFQADQTLKRDLAICHQSNITLGQNGH
jgi:hypothetical protein